MRTNGWVCLGFVGLLGCSNELGSAVDEPVGETEEAFYYASGAIWENTQISVCWHIDSTDDFAPETGWVKQAVEAAFEPFTNLNFTGWTACTEAGAHVVIDANNGNWPSAPAVPRSPSPQPNVFLNHFLGAPRDYTRDGIVDRPECWTEEPINQFSYTGITGREWDNPHRRCVEVVAVHEFFHVVGGHHEQNRTADKPGWCGSGDDGFGDTPYGYWDATSVSNYCNPAWDGDGYLSQLDYSGLNMLYGWGSNDRVWYGIGNVRTYGGVPHDQVLFETRSEDHTGNYTVFVGNFDGDGEDDIVLYRPGSSSDFIRFGRSFRGFDQITIDVTSTYQPVAGDFDGDGNDDIFWHAPGSSADKLWFGKDDRTFDKTTPTDVGGETTAVVSGDFDGDNKDDLYFYRAGSPGEKLMFGRGDRTFDNVTTSDVGGNFQIFTGDFDGDNKDDIFWYRPGTSTDYIWFGRSSRNFTTFDFTVNGTYTFASGDFDGNGTSDVLWNGVGESDYLSLFSENTRGLNFNTRISSIVADETTGVESAPFAGNFDGDDRDDVFWYSKN